MDVETQPLGYRKNDLRCNYLKCHRSLVIAHISYEPYTKLNDL